jgi:ribosomal-protein-alanine N-acetyltransferase
MKRTTKRKKAQQVGTRVYLRFPEAADGDEFIELQRASRRFYRGLATPMVSHERFLEYVKRCRQADFAGFLVCRVANDAIVGSMNLSQIVRGPFKSAYLGYQVGAPFARQGYLREALALLLRQAFTTMKLHRLEANIQPHNLASIALARGAGFVREGYSRRYLKIDGRWRDHERWAILREDWSARQRCST